MQYGNSGQIDEDSSLPIIQDMTDTGRFDKVVCQMGFDKVVRQE